MPRYLIEREIAGARKLSAAELQGVSQKSCGVLQRMGPQIQWVQSVTGDTVSCVYIPANRISEINAIIDPATAEKH